MPRRGLCLAAFLAVSVLAACPAPAQDPGPAGVGPPPLYPVDRAGLRGFVDASGSMSKGLARVKKNGKWGYVDGSGTVVIPPRFDYARDFTGGTARVRIGSREAAIDRRGNVLEKGP